jgi:hypothetical protein
MQLLLDILIGLVVLETLDMRLMDVVATYLYGSLDKNIHMKILEGFKMLETFYDKPISVNYIKLNFFLWVEAIWSNVI